MYINLIQNLWIEMNQFRICINKIEMCKCNTTNGNDQSNQFRYEIESSVFLCVQAMCRKKIWHFIAKKIKKLRKKQEKYLPEIYITINKWRKSNFTLSLAPISSCFFIFMLNKSRGNWIPRILMYFCTLRIA